MAWRSTVKAVWLLENNLNDDTANGNNAESYGGSFSYSNTIKKEGSYSLYVANNYAYAINTGRGPTAPPPTALTEAITDDTTGFWCEAWVYDTGIGARDIFGVEGLQGAVIRLTTDGANAQCMWNNTTVNIGNYNVNTEKETWIHWAYTYDRANDTLKIYKNGSLIYTRTAAGDYVAGDRALLIGMSWNQASQAYFDRVIIGVGEVPTAFPTLPLSAPTITDISPLTGSVSGGTTVTITGTEFATGATVTFDGDSATDIVVVSTTEITCVTPAHAAGAVDVVVTNTDTGTVTAVNGYTYVNPTITDITPLTGTTAGGTAVTITGALFMAGATVTFGGDAATSVVVVSDTSITCVTPAHAAGAVDVVVTNTDASTVTAVEGFTYVVPFTADTHFTSAIYPQDFTVFLTDTDITNFQKEPYERNEELNVIDTFDFAFDKVTASAPLEFFKFLNNRAQNTLKIKNKSGNTIYIGKVSGVKSGMEINFANKSLFIESYPLIEDISTDFAIYNIAATNPIKIIKQLLDASVDAAYTVSKIHGLATVLSGISIAVNTDGEEENTKSIIQSICEAFNIGVYIEDLTVRAYAVQILPNDATDITPYLVNLRPKFTSRGDLYADKIMLTYTPTLGGTEATITAGTGDTAKEITISAPIFIDTTSAGLAAERALAIYSQEFYEAELEADKTAMFKLGDTVKYPSELGNFICLIIGKNTTRNQITYKVLGVLK